MALRSRATLFWCRPLLLAGTALLAAGLSGWAGDCRGTKPKDKPQTDLPNNLAVVRAGQLEIETEEGRGRNVLLNDCALALPPDLADAMYGLALVTEPIPLPDEDIVLVMENTGGSGCPTYWRLLRIKPDGASVFSAEFGNCSDFWRYEYKGDRLEVVIGEAGGEQHVVYQQGRMTCDTCEKTTSSEPLLVDGHRLEIRQQKGQLEELLADGKPVGVRALWLSFVGEPMSLGAETLVIVQRGGIKGSCTRRHVLVVRKADGSFVPTDEFGNCTPYPNPVPIPGGLRVIFPATQGRPRQEVVYRGGKIAISGKPIRFKEVEESFASLDAVYADIADGEVSSFFQTEDRRTVAEKVKTHGTLLRHPLPDGREMLQVSIEIGDPMDFQTVGCTGKCHHQFYVGDKGRFHRAGDYIGFVTLDVTRQPVTLLVEDQLLTGSECYALSRPAPGYQDNFRIEKGPDNPCGLKDGVPARR